MARPFKKIDKSQFPLLEKMAQAGLTLDQMAAIFEVSTTTFDEILVRQPEVKRAIEKGRSVAIMQVGSTAFQQAVSGKVPIMTMFYLKTRARWAEARDVAPAEEGSSDFSLNYKK